MRAIVYLSFIFIFVFDLFAGDIEISDSDFIKLPLAAMWEKIEDVEEPRKSELITIYHKRALIIKYRGEKGFKRHQTERVLQRRGLSFLFDLLGTKRQIWSAYTNGIQIDLENAGLTGQELSKSLEALLGLEKDINRESDEVLFPLLINIAASEDASNLNKRAELLNSILRTRHLEGYPSPPRGKDIKSMEVSIHEIFSQLAKLQHLSQEEVDSEFKSLPQEEIVR